MLSDNKYIWKLNVQILTIELGNWHRVFCACNDDYRFLGESVQKIKYILTIFFFCRRVATPTLRQTKVPDVRMIFSNYSEW